MSAWPDAPAVRRFLARAARRIGYLSAARGAAEGLAVAIFFAVGGWPARGSMGGVAALALGCAAAGAIVRWLFTKRGFVHAAAAIEKRAPCLNLLVTAAELVDQPDRSRTAVAAVVVEDAARLTSRLHLAALFPIGRPVTVLGAVAGLWIAATVFAAGRPMAPPTPVVVAPDRVALGRVTVRVLPPAYTGQAEQTLRDPSRVEALAGSRLQVAVTATAASVALETIAGRRQLTSPGDGTFTGDVTADTDGFLAIEPAATNGEKGVRRLIGLGVTADRAPRVRVTAPGRDLFFADARRSVDVAIEADDDLALETLKLRFTKVAGSGENFTFTEGDTPLAIVRDDDRTWKARGSLKLDALELAAGDMVVYRGVATDRRPGASATESDTFIVEILAPGAVAAEGFAVGDERDRYAISQQMVILKTERLLARKQSTSAEDFAYQAAGLAAEQRQVRAEFVFMMGGELAEELTDASSLTELNEVAEAEGEADIAAGLLANQGRADLIRAIRSMSHASTSLNAAAVDRALKEERQALVYLQRAFTRARFILRALTERERLDLSRRLTGVLAALARGSLPASEPPSPPRVVELRRALAAIAGLTHGGDGTRARAARAATLAQSIVSVDAGSERLQSIATSLGAASEALLADRTDTARTHLDLAARTLAAVVRAELPPAPPARSSADTSRLDGALADALRRPPGAPR
jgi:hypothetical protein